MKVRRISYEDWLDRLDQLLELAIDRSAGSFGGVMWEKLYNMDYSPGEVFEAFVEEYRAVESEVEVRVID